MPWQTSSIHWRSQLTTGCSNGLELLSQAFPALHSLKLDAAGNLDGAVLSGLQGCQQLCQLHLHNCGVSREAVESSAAALGRLPSLKEVSLWGSTPLELVAQLTGLTKLAMQAPNSWSIDWVQVATHNPQLQCLSQAEAWGPWSCDVPASSLEQVLRACPGMTQLQLACKSIDQAGLDVLLTHGSNITSLAAFSLDADTSRADAQCSWEELHFSTAPKLQHIAYLPLKTVKFLSPGLLSDLGPDLRLPVGTMPDDQLPALLHQAAANLASAPAWQLEEYSHITLRAGSRTTPHNLSSELRLQLLQALAPLKFPRETKLELYGCDCGRPEVAALQHSLGSELTILSLAHCSLTPCFWSALHQLLPNLTEVTLERQVECQVSDLIVFCCTRPARRQFELYLGDGMYDTFQGDSIQASLQEQGLTHVVIG
jgi:hypothetical protein